MNAASRGSLDPKPEQKSIHDAERDRIAEDWDDLPSFVCGACRIEKPFPLA